MFVTFLDGNNKFSANMLSFNCHGLRFIDKRYAQSLTGGLNIDKNKLAKILSSRSKFCQS